MATISIRFYRASVSQTGACGGSPAGLRHAARELPQEAHDALAHRGGGQKDPERQFASITIPVEEVAEDVEHSESTVYEALARLAALGLLVRDEIGHHRINARHVLSSNPDLWRLIAAALVDPPVTPDARAQAPRKVGNADARGRSTMRPV